MLGGDSGRLGSEWAAAGVVGRRGQAVRGPAAGGTLDGRKQAWRQTAPFLV